MSDHASQADLGVTTLIQDSGSSHQSNPLVKFKFWSNNFDDLKYLYDHLSVIEDVEKVKTIGVH